MKILPILLPFFLCGVCMAQTPQFSVTASSVDSIPQTTVVPVQQPPVRITDRTTVYENTHPENRVQRRADRARAYAARIDSLVQSRNYLFFPNTMQEVPAGLIRSIYAEYFYFGLFTDHVEVHLPTERSVTQYVEMLNFDSMSIRDYRAVKLQWGWNITFDLVDGESSYHIDMEVSTVTGETVLTLITPHLTMRYVGWLWDKWRQGSRSGPENKRNG